MKKVIDNFIKQNDLINNFLNSSGQDYENVDKLMPLFIDILNQTKFNAALGLSFARFLQLSNDKSIFEQYELTDISEIFTTLVKLQTTNLDTYLEAANYEWAIMDNQDKARVIVTEGLIKARQNVEELEKLLVQINEE